MAQKLSADSSAGCQCSWSMASCQKMEYQLCQRQSGCGSACNPREPVLPSRNPEIVIIITHWLLD